MPPRFLLLCLASLGAVAFLAWPPARPVAAPKRPVAASAVAPAPAVGSKVFGERSPPVRVAPASPGSAVIGFGGAAPDRATDHASGVIGGASVSVRPEPKVSAAAIRADAQGRPATGGQARVDALGHREVRLDNGVVATTTKDALGGSTTRYSNGIVASSRTDALGGTTTTYSNGVTASSRKDALGNVDTSYSDGTHSTTRTDPFGNQVTTYSDGRTETIRPDPFAPRPSDPKAGRK